MTAVSKRTSVSSPSLQLFQPDASGSDPGETLDEITLREAFVRFLEPDVRANAAKGTLTQYNVTLGNWERLTSNPPIGKISDPTLIAFRTARLEDEARTESGCRHATVNKDLRTLHAILRRVGPRTDRNPRGQGILQFVPYCTRLGDQGRRKRMVSKRQGGDIYKACDVAVWPSERVTGVHPARLWRALVVCLWHWGANRGDLLRLTASDVAYGDGNKNGFKPNAKRLYVEFVRQKTRGKKPEPIVLPVARTVARHLKPFLARGGVIFRFPKNNRDFKRQWEAILREAGIPLGKKEKVFFQDLRKTCSSLYDEIDPGLGAWVLGHAPRDVNSDWYAIVVNRLRRAVRKFDRLMQPREFRRAEERQQRLF